MFSVKHFLFILLVSIFTLLLSTSCQPGGSSDDDSDSNLPPADDSAADDAGDDSSPDDDSALDDSTASDDDSNGGSTTTTIASTTTTVTTTSTSTSTTAPSITTTTTTSLPSTTSTSTTIVTTSSTTTTTMSYTYDAVAACNETVSGDNTGKPDRFDIYSLGGCYNHGCYYPSPEYVFRMDFTEPTHLRATFGYETTCYQDLFLLDETFTPDGMVAAGDGTLSYEVPGAGTYYLVVDGYLYPDKVGPFTIDIACGEEPGDVVIDTDDTSGDDTSDVTYKTIVPSSPNDYFAEMKAGPGDSLYVIYTIPGPCEGLPIYYVFLADNSTGIWTTQPVEVIDCVWQYHYWSTAGGSEYPSLALDDAGAIYATWGDRNAGEQTYPPAYSWTSGTLKFEKVGNEAVTLVNRVAYYPLDVSYLTGDGASMVMDGDGHPHVTFMDTYGGEAGGFASLILPDDADPQPIHVDSCWGATWGFIRTSLALDSGNHNHIAYVCPNNNWGGPLLKYATDASGQWDLHAIDIGGGDSPSVAVGADQRVHVVYVAGGKLKYALKSAGGWTVDDFAAAGTQVDSADMALDDLGHLHIAFTEISTGNPVLHYLTDTSGSWRVRTIANDGDAPTIALDTTGAIHVVYSGPSGLVLATFPGS